MLSMASIRENTPLIEVSEKKANLPEVGMYERPVVGTDLLESKKSGSKYGRLAIREKLLH